MEYKNFIGGAWEDAGAGVANINPSDIDDTLGYAACSSTDVTECAIEAATTAKEIWSRSTPQDRFDVLDFIGSEILSRKEELGHLLSREEGKTFPEGVGEAARAGQIFKFFAGQALRLSGELLPSVRPGVGVEITRTPIGVVGLITPWNFPIAIPAWKIAPAVCFGNTVVFKPAELVPASAHALVEIISRSGLPHGAVNLVFGKGSVVGSWIVESDKVDAISFTGSIATGRKIAATCGASLKKCQLEMGGKNPIVVLNDADLETAVDATLQGAFFSTGQRCTASSRIIATSGIHDRFVAALIERMTALNVGHALEKGVDLGPVVDRIQLEKNQTYIEMAASEGGAVVGGDQLKLASDGFYMSPALVTETTNQMRINREEVFGPVASVIRVKDYDEALHVANDTEFGLSAGICTTSLRHAKHFKENAQAGMIMVNLPTAGVDYHVPFGGTKGSSFGAREQGAYASEFYTSLRTAYTLP